MRIAKFFIAIIICYLCVSFTCNAFAQENNFVPNQIIVKYKQNESPENLNQAVGLRTTRSVNFIGYMQNLAENIGTTLTGNQTPETKLEKLNLLDQQIKLKDRQQLTTQSSDKSLSNVYLLKTDTTDITTLINTYKSSQSVESVEPNIILKINATPNDTYFPDQWHYSKIALPQAWDITTGTNNIVAVLDSGIDYNHNDLPLSRIIKGHDYVNNDDDPKDDNGHGTFVSGIIGAITNNNLGVAGINWNVRLLVYKILDSTGQGDTYSLIQSITSAADYGAKVINLSLGGITPCSAIPTLQNAINYAYGKGVSIVVAAGNENSDAANYSPASCNNVITVAATGFTDLRASYSNYGSVVDIAAPGGDVYGGIAYIISTSPNNGISSEMGTSFAAPHVSGVVSLMLSSNPGLTTSDIETMLKNSGDTIISNLNIGKRLNAYKTLLLVTGQPIPTPLPSPSATPGPVGLTINPTSVNTTIAQNTSKQVLTLTSTGCTGFQFIGTPTTNNSNIQWYIGSGGIVINNSIQQKITVYANTSLGTYSGTGKIKCLTTNAEMTFPVIVTVVATEPSPTPLPTPSYTFSDLKQLLTNFLSIQDSTYYPIDNKVNILDAGWIIKWLH